MTVDGEGPYKEVQQNLFALDGNAGPFTRTIGFSEVDGMAVMGPHTLLSNRRLATFEIPLLTVGGLLLAPFGLLLIAAGRRRVIAPATESMDWTIGGASIAFLALICIELVWAPELQREQDLGWMVSLWRVGLHVVLAGLVWGCLKAWAPLQLSIRTGLYAALQSVLTVWVVFAAGYWHVLGKL
jgi:hypothetical protein